MGTSYLKGDLMVRALLAALVLAACACDAASVDTPTISTSDGRSVEVSVYAPEATGRRPCLVVAPGAGYHRGMPIITDLAHQAAAAGLVVVTFDWEFFTGQSRPSEGFADEVADLEAVISFARRHPRVEPSKIVLAGKSLGSVVAHRVFAGDAGLVGLVLYTPLIRQPGALADLYSEAASGSRPVAMALGDADPNCPLAVLYRALGAAQRQVPVVVVGGNHGLELGDGSDPATHGLTITNIQAANAAALVHVRLMLGR